MQESLALTASFPKELAMTGELKLSRKGALKITGRIFRLRMEVNLSSGILGELRNNGKEMGSWVGTDDGAVWSYFRYSGVVLV